MSMGCKMIDSLQKSVDKHTKQVITDMYKNTCTHPDYTDNVNVLAADAQKKQSHSKKK